MKNKEKQIDRGIRLHTQRSKKILGTLTGEETFYAKNIDKELSVVFEEFKREKHRT